MNTKQIKVHFYWKELSKTLKVSEILLYLQTHKLYGCWVKKWDSWVRDEGLIITYSSSSSQSICIFVLIPWGPIPIDYCEESQMTPANPVGWL